MLFWLSKTKRLEIYFSMLYLQNLPSFPLKCHPIHPEIHNDPSIGALRASYDTLMAAMVVAGIVS